MSRLHPLVAQNVKENMMVVWTNGKPTTVIKNKEEGGDEAPTLAFQYKIPLSKYNTLATVASRRSKRSPTDRPLPQIVTIQQLPPSGDDEEHTSEHASPQHEAPATVPEDNVIYSKLEKEYNALKTKEQEEQVELRRLRTENRLLRQRIDNLEKETGTLADRLIQDQVKYAQQEEEVYMLRRDLCVAKQHSQDANQKLDAVTNQLEEIKERSDSQSSSASAEELEDLRTKDEKIEQLEQQLAEVKRQLSESQCTIKELKNKIRELENQNQQLTTEPSKEIEHLQEELIASKLREAEANLALKELQQKVHELEKHWQKYLEQQTLSNVKMTKDKSHQLADDLISMRMKEAEAVAELQENKLKLMELETQNHICSRQIKRQEDEIEKLNKAVEDGKNREKELLNEIKELTRKISNIESKQKEDSMMTKIKDAEHTQTIAEMRRRIAELEIENQELVTAGQLQDRGDRQDLENRLADLQEELLQLKMARRLQSLSSLALNNINLDSETDYDSDDVEATRLRLNDDGMTTDAGRPTGLDLADLDSSDGESPTEPAEGAACVGGRHRTTRRKRKAALRHGLDLDKTPTQDSVNGAFFGSDQNGRLAAGSDGQTDSGRMKALTNGATTCRSRQPEICTPEDGL